MGPINFLSLRQVARYRGTLPLIITCPHGGSEQPAGVPERDGSATPPGCQFEKNADLDTREIAAGVAQRMLELFGEAPYVVMAEFHRKYIDANRSPECAYEVAAAGPFYDEYHEALRNFVDDIRAENGGLGWLFDIHGTTGVASDPADVYLGTDNGSTVARALAADPDALFRRRSLRSWLQAAGRVVSPPAPGERETPTLDGGFTVRHYGSGNADGIDAMQLEIIAALRRDPVQRAALIDELAFAFGNLAGRFADSRVLGAADETTLRLGGPAGHRGRVEIAHDALAADAPGLLVMNDARGRRNFVWVDTRGRLRLSRTEPRRR